MQKRVLSLIDLCIAPIVSAAIFDIHNHNRFIVIFDTEFSKQTDAARCYMLPHFIATLQKLAQFVSLLEKTDRSDSIIYARNIRQKGKTS